MLRARAFATVLGIVLITGCAGIADARSPDTPIGLVPGWTAETAAEVAQFYPPARTRLLVSDVPEPLVDALRHAGFQIIENTAVGAVGEKLLVQTVAQPDGIFVIVRIRNVAMSSLWGPTGRLTDWSIGTYDRGVARHAKGSK